MDRYADDVGSGLINGNSIGTVEARIKFDEDDLVEDVEFLTFGSPELDKIAELAKNLIIYESISGINEMTLEDFVIDGSYNPSMLFYEAIGAAIADYIRKAYMKSIDSDDDSVDNKVI